MLRLSSATRTTRNQRKPLQAGAGAPADAVRPGLPRGLLPSLPSACSSRACSERLHPGLSAGMRSARTSCSRG